MARLYSRKKGKSGSTKPVKENKKAWMTYTAKEVEQLVVKIAKQGKEPSKIGIILRDSYGIPCVREITKKKIVKILEENNIKLDLPEDLTSLIKRHIIILKHLEENKKDFVSKRGSQLTESKIRRLMKYYKKAGKLALDWKYSRDKAELLIS